MSAVRKINRLDSAGDLPDVYEQYKPELRNFVSRRVDNEDDAEDIVHDIFYKLAKIDLLENPIEYLSSWLYQSALNRVIDLKRKKREKSLPENRTSEEDEAFLQTLSGFLADESDEPQNKFSSMIIMEEIETALSELPADQRTVFEMTEFEGVSYKQISKATGIPVATLLSRKHYAVNYIRKKLSGLYEEL